MSSLIPQDHQALQDLMLNYAAAIDERDYQRYKACFAENVAVFNFGNQAFHGRQAWLDYVWQALQKYSATQHLLAPLLAELDGDKASTRSDVQAQHFLADDPTQTLTLWATYQTDMQRIEGEWKIVRHELVVRGSRAN